MWQLWRSEPHPPAPPLRGTSGPRGGGRPRRARAAPSSPRRPRSPPPRARRAPAASRVAPLRARARTRAPVELDLGDAVDRRRATAAAAVAARSASSIWIVSPSSARLSSSGVPAATMRAAVDDRDLGGELVGLLEVVRRREGSSSARRRRAARSRARARRAPRGRGRSSARRGRARAGGGGGPWRCRDAAASRPSRSWRAGRPRRQVEAREPLVDPRAQLAAREVVDRALEDEVLAAGRLGVEAVLLPDDADRAPHALGAASTSWPATAASPRVGAGQRGEDLDGRRLAGAVRARAGRRSSPPRPRGRGRRAPATSGG